MPWVFLSRLVYSAGSASPGGALDSSPRRKPWVRNGKIETSPGGAKDILNLQTLSMVSFAPAGESPLPSAGRILSTATTSRQIQFSLKLLF